MDYPTLPGGAPVVALGADELETLNSWRLLELTGVFGDANGGVGNGYDALLRRAIESFADGDRATSSRQRVLSYIASCELFFTRRSDTTAAVVSRYGTRVIAL